ncbi:MAG: hypothetical protein JXQ73_19980 [Phycisphaerae bacterium]|nr:hypothetical protein [Phycisphaerae bacterium]
MIIRSRAVSIAWSLLISGTPCLAGEPTPPVVKQVPGQAELGFIEIHGVAAGAFQPGLWQEGALHWLPDVRSPLIRPRWSGVFRNIYAPSIVEVPSGWRVFYGAWDGVDTGNDRIYSLVTNDFLDFRDRATVIGNGVFIHACNVSAIRFDDGSYHMLCTVYPDLKKQNKPAAFHSPDGRTWNGSPAPYPARMSDIVEMTGYPPYEEADINGVNVLFFEGGTYYLYFNNWRDAGRLYRASGEDGKRFRFDGTCLETSHAVNDVKKFVAGGRPRYLMALHRNTDRLWYALSDDGMRFGPERELVTHLGDQDRYIVAVGWVVRGDRLLGFLYGAGAVPGLNRNRIFARWLQKRVVFVTDDGKRLAPTQSLGPDRQLIPIVGEIKGHFEVFAEDGKTRLAQSPATKAVSGAVYVVDTPQ